MKPIGEEQQEVASALNDRAVVDYLLQHPEFFIRNAAQVEHIRVPHPVRGSISLVEWHMMRARNHIHVLEENMSLLMEQAVAAAEVGVGLAIVLAIFRNYKSVDLDQVDLMKG